MNKKIVVLFICLSGLFLISGVSATDDLQHNGAIASGYNTIYQITSDLSNNDIQYMFDNAMDGDTFEFTSKEYYDISLVVDKQLNIVSNKNSVVYASNQISDKAKSLGITDTFGFYFTSKSAGSVLSGITIIAPDCDYGVVVDSSDNTTVENNVISGGENCVLVKNSDAVTVFGNNISNATANGLQLKNVKSSVISNNTISYNVRSGIETSNIYSCNITNNTVHHNDFNGISMFDISNGNAIKYNVAYENPNGIYINSKSTNDVINANSFTYNRIDTSYELGAFESGNGLLFGADFKTAKKENDPSKLVVKYNVLAHNEGYQAKNNPELPVFKLGDNWFDSTDDENTFVCPMLLAGIMKMNTISVKNGIGLQMYDTNGNEVKEFGTFDTTVSVNGNQYTAKFVNGKAIINANLDSNVEYDVAVKVGNQYVNYKYTPAPGQQGESSSSETTPSEGETGSPESSSNNNGTSGVQGDSSAQGNSTSNSNSSSQNNSTVQSNSTAQSESTGTTNSSGSQITNSAISGNYGTNSSDIPSQDTTDMGNDELSNGDLNARNSGSAGDSNSGEASEEGKAYEIVPPAKKSNKVTDTSGIVLLSIVVLLGCLVLGYRRNNKLD